MLGRQAIFRRRQGGIRLRFFQVVLVFLLLGNAAFAKERAAGPRSQIAVHRERVRVAIGDANGRVSNPQQFAGQILRLSQILEGRRHRRILCWDGKIANRNAGERKA
ncbi:hypothetical protein XF30_21000 [Bradyrhizobium sp. SUTN9-2]|nr:hypothetical protein XF30_21000 [Bradyrhizobium sp. SUTN9-2]